MWIAWSLVPYDSPTIPPGIGVQHQTSWFWHLRSHMYVWFGLLSFIPKMGPVDGYISPIWPKNAGQRVFASALGFKSDSSYSSAKYKLHLLLMCALFIRATRTVAMHRLLEMEVQADGARLHSVLLQDNKAFSGLCKNLGHACKDTVTRNSKLLRKLGSSARSRSKKSDWWIQVRLTRPWRATGTLRFFYHRRKLKPRRKTSKDSTQSTGN